MHCRFSIGILALLASLLMPVAGANAFDESKYPNWKGAWDRGGIPPRWVPTGQKAPLTPEYQKIFEWNTADQKAGGHGWEPSWMCLPPGMPRIMNVFEPMEIVITPATTYILISHIHDNRRIYTDGRDWPTDIEPSFKGYSIGKWLDTDGDGRYDTLEVETRNLKGPRAYDTSGLPLHYDSKTVVKEKIYNDKTNPDIILNEITTIDSALTGPWTITKKYFRGLDARSQLELDRGDLLRKQSACPHRRRQLHAERRRLSDAGQEGPEAARPALFQVGLRRSQRGCLVVNQSNDCRGLTAGPAVEWRVTGVPEHLVFFASCA